MNTPPNPDVAGTDGGSACVEANWMRGRLRFDEFASAAWVRGQEREDDNDREGQIHNGQHGAAAERDHHPAGASSVRTP